MNLSLSWIFSSTIIWVLMKCKCKEISKVFTTKHFNVVHTRSPRERNDYKYDVMTSGEGVRIAPLTYPMVVHKTVCTLNAQRKWISKMIVFKVKYEVFKCLVYKVHYLFVWINAFKCLHCFLRPCFHLLSFHSCPMFM